ncbi:DUF1499 domain-containing protein [Rheinheimera salexigens]|uniref:DUF1499 domain-containing protein n=1 Tax=Rheinheimera salexigens TaxID=1628148 RepID=A0A1E7Q8N7_9GAMM|nr:DUF1499 domain-containing protein [Rheinheimera salexigens]OEY70423.1 hypothetical protein BI198_13205 [Rheinheimera salexigens]
MQKRSFSKATSKVALFLALLAVATVALMVFGSSMGLWDPIVGFMASRKYNDLLGYIVVGVALLALMTSFRTAGKDRLSSIVALLLGLAILAPSMLALLIEPVKYPPIHDITTNSLSPPQFTFLTDSRPGAKNSLVYGGADIAAQQLQAYPTIKPIVTELSNAEAYQKALTVAKDMGWTIVYKDPQALRFESTARTPFFNFADYVVVEVSTFEQSSRIDLRSVSRIGIGDRGVNAKRIQEFSQRFSQ